MQEVLTELAGPLTLLCPLVIGPLCFFLILAKWIGRRMQSDGDKRFLNRRLAASLLILIPLTGFMCLLSLFYIMADRFDDTPRAAPLGDLVLWLSFPVGYICVCAWLVYLMWAPIYKRLP